MSRQKKQKLNLEEIRERIKGLNGPAYWRSLEELAASPEFQEQLHREFPENASQWLDPVSRRGFLKLMGASMALAGLTACTRQPTEMIVPYVNQPEELTPGKPLFFATAMTLNGMAAGLLVESHTGRPTKVEGNPQHPATLGATDVYAQASILGLYDPDRSQTITQNGEISTWSDFQTIIRQKMDAEKAKQKPGAGFRLLTETLTSPSLVDQIQTLINRYPGVEWHQYEPVSRDGAREGARMAFGRYVDAQYHFDKAEVIVALDSDFLACGPASVRHARDFATRRRVRAGTPNSMSRLYSIECMYSNTGAKADHRLPVSCAEVSAIGVEIARAVGVAGLPQQDSNVASRYGKWIAAIARDLKQYHGAGIVIAGDFQPAYLHALAHAINESLGNNGTTVTFIEAVEPSPINQIESLRTLAADMNAGKVQTLLILGGNPVYNAPADLAFDKAMAKVPLRINLSPYDDETSFLCHWHIPQAHYLESWGDARAFDGTATIIQPLIAPLYGECKAPQEILAAMLGTTQSSAYEVVQQYWKGQPVDNFDQFWRKALNDGVVPNSTAAPVSVTASLAGANAPATPKVQGPEIVFRPDPAVYDGRFANNGWLQEMPRTFTKVTWDNVAMISPALAQKLGLQTEDVVILEHRGRKVRAPVWIQPGQPAESITVTLGYGRERVGRAGSGVGFNAYLLQSSESPWVATGVKVEKTGDTYTLASTQHHHLMEGRGIVRSATLQEYAKNPRFAQEQAGFVPSLLPQEKWQGYQWGMVIDQNACVGCNACVVACQAENNVPIVGKDQVRRGREMHWLRIDDYFQGDMENPEIHFQPMLCQHCEKAPCELVCPVGATVHSAEGLNQMVYNRCVGTRYCSNNCPYKVRRFNFYLYADYTPVIKLAKNPDVTVRTRGVMEKCSYCIQRIQRGKIEAEDQDRTVRDGEIQTACQQACPTQAIVFGNIGDRQAKVRQLKQEPTNYGVLEDLDTRPRTTYLAAVKNPNPELK